MKHFSKVNKLVLNIIQTFLLVLILSVQANAQYSNTHYIAPSPWQYFNKYNELVITTLSITAVPVTITGSDGTLYSNSLTTIAGKPLRYRFAGVDGAVNASATVLSGQGLIISGTSAISVFR